MLVTAAMTQKQICEHLGFGQSKYHVSATKVLHENPPLEEEEQENLGDYLVYDSIYQWNEQILDWVTVKDEIQAPRATFVSYFDAKSSSEPIVIDWRLLLDIKYQLKYFSAIEMEIYAPVFSDSLKAIDGKEVIIEGFVIPFDETGEIVALSANPFAACFFCGKASPASVISMYLKHQKRYKMDDFRKFHGVLQLNYEAPNEYYYILKEMRPVKEAWFDK